MRCRRFELFASLLFSAAIGIGGCSSDAIEGADPIAGGGTSGGGGASTAPRDYAAGGCYGETATTTVYDGQTHQLSSLSATCRGEGERTRLYVVDALFGSRITQAEVNGFLHRFEVDAHGSGAGVLATNEGVFGELPAASIPSGKLPIFVIDTERAGEGYLCGWCEQPELHLDGILLQPFDGDEALSIAAHESYHAISRGYDADETIWVDESLAEAAMTVNGFFSDAAFVSDFLENPNVDWGPGGGTIADFHYGAGLLFGSYLWEQGGPLLMAAATKHEANGWQGLDAALSEIGDARAAYSLFLEMAVALYVNDVQRGYGFSSFELPRTVRTAELAAGASSTGLLQPYGLVYVKVGAPARVLRVEGPATLDAMLLLDSDPAEVRGVEVSVDTPLPSAPAVLVLTARAPASYSVVAAAD